MPTQSRVLTVTCLSLLLGVAGCGRPAPPPTAAGVPQVTVRTLQPQPVVINSELPGRTAPFRVAEVRARVDGIVLVREFSEGSDVQAGQLLYRIDPAPYQAALSRAEAALAKARADVAAKRLQAQRLSALRKQQSVSQQALDDAQASWQQAEADVAAAQADVETARINLGYTAVTAPIDGRIGKSLVTEGAYVRKEEATPLAVVQQLDPLYVDVVRSSAELLQLRQDVASGLVAQPVPDSAPVTLTLEDGSHYAHNGRLQFADSTVDPGTGSVTLRAVVPNPEHQLLPGMFVHARLENGSNTAALLVPQQAVTFNASGEATTLVVGPDKVVALRVLQLGRAIGHDWLVKGGIAPGERVVMEGLQRAAPGSTVEPVEMAAPAP